MVEWHDQKVLSILKAVNGKEETEEMQRMANQEIKRALNAFQWTKLKTDTAVMWVHKGCETVPRGKKFLNSKEVKAREENGEKFRTVRYPKNKSTKRLCSAIATLIEGFTLPEQKGFKTGKNVFHALQPHVGNHTVLELDGASAFNTVPKEFVYKFFKNIIRLNNTQARFLAECCTDNGYLYQGNPLSPALYNVYQVLAIASLRKLKNVRVSSYADDLIISTPFKRMSYKFRRLILKILKECGIKVNEKKTHFGKVDRLIKLGGHIDTLEIARKQKFKKKIRLFEYLQKKHGVLYTKRLNKAQKPIEIREMIVGLKAWLNFPEDKRKSESHKTIQKTKVIKRHKKKPRDNKKQEKNKFQLENDLILLSHIKQYIIQGKRSQEQREKLLEIVETETVLEEMIKFCEIELFILGLITQEDQALFGGLLDL